MAKNKIFIEGNDYYEFARFGWQNKDRALLGLREGYFNAANDLVDIVLKEGKKKNIKTLDTYIFPIVFLYRHSLEITLKQIYLRWYGKIPDNKNNHDLIVIWDKIHKEIIIKELGIKDNEISEQIRKFLIEINKYDNKSDYFRYLMDKDGKLYFNKKQNHIDYPNLKENMQKLYDDLDGLYSEIDDFLSGDIGEIY